MSVDGADLSKITKSTLDEVVAAAVPVAAKKSGWFLSRALAAVLAVALPLVGAVAGYFGGRATVAPASVEAPVGSGSGSAAVPAAEGTAATVIPYDAKTVAADAVLGTPDGTGEAVHPAHPADAATAAEADAK